VTLPSPSSASSTNLKTTVQPDRGLRTATVAGARPDVGKPGWSLIDPMPWAAVALYQSNLEPSRMMGSVFMFLSYPALWDFAPRRRTFFSRRHRTGSCRTLPSSSPGEGPSCGTVPVGRRKASCRTPVARRTAEPAHGVWTCCPRRGP